MGESEYLFLVVTALILVILFPVLLIAVVLLYHGKRKRGLERIAVNLGFTYSPKNDGLILSQMGDWELFSRGRRKITHVLQGQIDQVDITLMDYRLATGSGQNSFVQNQTVVLFESKNLQLPHFLMQSENVFQKMVGALGEGDINFSSHPTFSRHYHLKGPDFLAIRNLFSEKILNYFEIHQGWKMEGKDNRLVLYRAGKRVKPEELPSFLKQGQEILQLFESIE